MQTSWMKVYSTDIINMPKIRAIYDGYIFRSKTKEGLGLVKCSIKQKERIESYNIVLTLIT